MGSDDDIRTNANANDFSNASANDRSGSAGADVARHLTSPSRQWLRNLLADEPSFWTALIPFWALSMILFTRHPSTNFIFDEQEALLANPYVRSAAETNPKFGWLDAFHRDFWGLGPDRSIGSYRPIPDLVWRLLWWVGAREHTPFLHHGVNVVLHGVNGALVYVLAFQLTRRSRSAWLAGFSFTACAVLTEAVSGVVGISDVLGATGALCALLSLSLGLPLMGVSVFVATLFGLYSKESALCCVPLVPLTALLTAQILHPHRPRRWLRATFAFVAAAAAFVFYVEARRRMFPTNTPAELSLEANAAKPPLARAFAASLRWFGQPSLPRDPLNNPLVEAHGGLRIGGALRVYLRGLIQLVFPYPLSGDYSAPQEPAPTKPIFLESVLGAIAMVGPLVAAPVLGVIAYRRRAPVATRDAFSGETFGALGGLALAGGTTLPFVLLPGPRAWIVAGIAVVIGGALVGAWWALRRRARLVSEPIEDAMPETIDVRPVIAAALLWITISYFPVSNIPALLPTIRAERFWYFPAIGSSLVLGIAFDAAITRTRSGALAQKAIVTAICLFFSFQAFAARRHAIDYTNDLTFWDATRKAVPRSAKAHLNYSVMKGARGDLEARLASSKVAFSLAPQWPMASIYLGDTLCRLHRAEEAWPHYVRGFELAPNDVNLTALALQCLWDEKMLVADTPIRAELATIKDKNPGSWVEYLGRDILEHGEEHKGVDPKYRPRGYNEGPKD